MITNTEEEKKIWGLRYTEKYDPELGLVWCPRIKSSFYFKGKMVIGLNEKFLRKAIENNIKIFMIRFGEEDENITYIPFEAPDAKTLNKMVKEKRYKDIPSMFKNGKPMRIFYFNI